MTNIQIENVSEVRKKITFEVSQDQVQGILDAQYRDLKKSVQLKGFRKGKAPLDIVRQYFRAQVEAEAVKQIVEDTLQPGLEEHQIVPVAVLSIDSPELVHDKPFIYTAEIEVPPPVEPKGYTGLTLTRYVRDYDEKILEERINGLAQRLSRLVPVAEARGIAKGDHIVADVETSIDGQPVTALTVVDYHMEIGRDFFIPGFDDRIIGLAIEERKEFQMDVPAEFPVKSIAGKTVTFNIYIKEAKEKKLPELDDEFAKDLGFESFDDLKNNMRKDLEAQLAGDTEREMQDLILDKLLEANEFEVPETMVDKQIDRFLDRSMQNLVAQGLDPKRIPPPSQQARVQLRPASLRIVRGGLILAAIAQKEQISVSDEEFDVALAKKAEDFQVSLDFFRDQLDKGPGTDDLRAAVLQEKLYKFIEAQAEITEEKKAAAPEGHTEAEKE